MTIESLNSAIIGVCEEIQKRQKTGKEWKKYGEFELLTELIFCIVSSQVKYEMAMAITDRIMQIETLNKIPSIGPCESICDHVYEALKSPIMVHQSDGSFAAQLPRFPKRISKFVSDTIVEIYPSGRTIHALLSCCSSPQQARKLLVEVVKGMGPKQASLFLRRINFSGELAVIDTHIMDYIKRANGILIEPSMISKIKTYESMETSYLDSIKSFGFSTGCVDLAMWITMRVGKQEALI